jgi:hypothetical protein
MADQLKALLKMHRVELEKAARKSVVWFEQQAFNLFDVQDQDPHDLIEGSNKRDLHTTLRPGNMYIYAYDAKTKDKLPYYDMFPLCLPYAPTPKGFIGLNLHYLPYDYRIKLLDRLMDFSSSETLDNKTKQYLWSQVRSDFRIIRPGDWSTAAMLPLERFAGSDKFTVWADSLAKI